MEVEPPAGPDMLAARVVALFGIIGYIGVWKGAGIGTEGCAAVELIGCGDEDVTGAVGGITDVSGFTRLVWGGRSVVPAIPIDVLFMNPYGGGAEETTGTLS